MVASNEMGNEATLSVSVSPAGAHCSLAVRYKSRAIQKGVVPSSRASGQASWNWKVPRLVQPGVAHATATCNGAGRATKSLHGDRADHSPEDSAGEVRLDGAPYPYGGSGVSYGVILANESKTRDAVDVKVLVHFVMDDNRLIGSATTRISDMAAGSEHAFGGELNFPGGAPIARLRGGRRGGRQRPCHADEAGAVGSARHAEPL